LGRAYDKGGPRTQKDILAVGKERGRIYRGGGGGGGGSVQSTAGSRGVRISCSNGSNAGYTMF